MVEAVPAQVDLGVSAPAVGLIPRTLNTAAPYGKRKIRRAKGTLPLQASEEELGDEKVVVSQRAQPEDSVKRIEQAGMWYGKLCQKYAKLAESLEKGASAHFEESEEEEKKEEKNSGSDDAEDEEDTARKEEFEKKRTKKTKADVEREALEGNLYGALEMQDKTYEATDKEITKAYRKMALKYHPDKLGDKLTERDKEVWLKIQEAYETLIDPAKKRKYDSSLPFDEKIPEEGTFTDETFYEVFTKCFDLNSRWS